ncbi:hypothetical protein ABCS02_22795 [Microbacterium sp. X-17]|uniref:MaoC family dehydratase n=1 Tax=Microbacterium sp. X-17 TaxID=3144404 RepID=UPI0031F55EBE
MADQRYFEDVEVGEALPTFVRRTTLMNWNRFAAVNDEFIPFHMDDAAGHAAGNEQGAFGMGNLRTSYVHNLLRAWIGDGDIREVSIQFRSINQKDDVLTATGVVVAKSVEGDDHLVRIDVDIVDQNGTSTTPGHAVVVLPSRP